jgi:hypothetical protein
MHIMHELVCCKLYIAISMFIVFVNFSDDSTRDVDFFRRSFENSQFIILIFYQIGCDIAMKYYSHMCMFRMSRPLFLHAVHVVEDHDDYFM